MKDNMLMMIRKPIKVGNSYYFTITKSFIEGGLIDINSECYFKISKGSSKKIILEEKSKIMQNNDSYYLKITKPVIDAGIINIEKPYLISIFQ